MNPPEQPTDAFARLAASDLPAGFAGLFERMAPALYAWAALKVHSRPLDAEDLVGDVWLAALESFERFERDKGSFRQWIFGVAAYVYAKTLRRLQLRQSKGDAEVLGSRQRELHQSLTAASEKAARSDDVQQVLAIAEEWSAEDRELVVHFGLEGLTANEAGALMQMKPGTANKRWQRLREKLRQRLGAAADSLLAD